MKKENDEIDFSDEEKDTQKPNLALLIGLSCAILAVVQSLCSMANLTLPINILVDIITLVLTILVSFKLVKSDKTGSVDEISLSIKQDIRDGLDSKKTTTKEKSSFDDKDSTKIKVSKSVKGNNTKPATKTVKSKKVSEKELEPKSTKITKRNTKEKVDKRSNKEAEVNGVTIKTTKNIEETLENPSEE